MSTVNISVLLEHTRDKIAVVDDDGTHRYVNEAARRILGYDPEAMIGEDAFEFVHPDDRAGVKRIFESVIDADGLTEATGRYRHRTRDGDWVWLESRFSNVSDRSLDGYVISSRDVTEQVETTRERERTQRVLEELTETVSDVMWMWDGDWSELLFVNPAFEDVYGMSLERLREDPTRFLETVHPEDVPCVEAAMERLSAGEPVEMEYRVNPGREYRNWVWVQGEPVVEDGEVTRIVGFSRDVTDRKRRERQLAVIDNLLRHNVKNDMEVILGNAEFVAEQGDEQIAEKADIIRRTGEQLLESADKQRQIIDLLTRPVEQRTVDLVRTVTAAIETVRERDPDAVIDLRLPSEARVRALEEVEAAVVELLWNAVRHDPTGEPEITVTVGTVHDEVELAIRDRCPPIPEREYEILAGEREMCEMYHTTGVGLWLVYWVVDLSDGTIRFERTDDPGNEITVALPRA